MLIPYGTPPKPSEGHLKLYIEWVIGMTIGFWTFNSFDIVVLLVVIISLFMAASRGLFRELISITALLVAGGFALFIFGRFRFAAQGFIKPAWLADWALGLGTFALGYLAVLLILSGVVKSLKGRDVSVPDRLLGAAFGAFRGLIVAALFVMVATASYREGMAAQDFKDRVLENRDSLPPDIIERAPKDVQDWLEAPPPELPGFLQGSTLYPVLDKIGDGLRLLPFSELRSTADKLRAGELNDLLGGLPYE